MLPLKSESLQIDTSHSPNDSRVLTLAGQLTMQTLFEFQQTCREHPEKPIILEMSGVAYMDSAGLGSLLGLFASCQRTNRKFAITGVNQRVRTLFQVAHVDQLLPTFASVAEADAQS